MTDGGSDQNFYPRAPITQAVFEIRFSENIPEDRQQHVSGKIRTRYANLTAEEQYEGTLDFQLQSSAFRRVGPLLRHTTSDLTDGLVIGANTVVWHRLAPYMGWKPLIERIAPELKIVLKALSGRSVARLGLRYVNRIDVPPSSDGLVHFEDYLNYKVDSGSILEPCLSYSWAVRGFSAEDQLSALVQSSTIDPEIPGLNAFTFDIDICSETDVPQSSDAILDKLERMRFYKNAIFEAGITDKARELYA